MYSQKRGSSSSYDCSTPAKVKLFKVSDDASPSSPLIPSHQPVPGSLAWDFLKTPPSRMYRPEASANELKEEPEVEALLVKEAEELEAKHVIKLNRTLENEKFRIIDEVTYPITKTCTKFVTVGVKPLEYFEPVLRINNTQLTAAIIFNLKEFEEFQTIVASLLPSVKNVTVIYLGEIERYDVFLSKNRVMQFRPRQSDDVYKRLYLSVGTVETVLNLSDNLINLMQARKIKSKIYPDYECFASEIASHILRNGADENMDERIMHVIKTYYDDNPYLYEVFLKLPCTLVKTIQEKLDMFKERNDWF